MCTAPQVGSEEKDLKRYKKIIKKSKGVKTFTDEDREEVRAKNAEEDGEKEIDLEDEVRLRVCIL